MELDGVFSKKNKKSPTDFYSFIKQQTREFCIHTTIHGFQYIAQIDKSVLTRFIWTFIIVMICIMAYIFIYCSWLYNTLNLTTTVSDTIFNPIWEYPFPGVTICNINKVSVRKAKEFAKKIKPENMTEDEMVKLLRHTVQIQYSFFYPQFEEEYEKLQRIFDERNITAEEAIFAINPDCSDLIFRCMWKGRIWNCEGLFQESRSSLGICCSVSAFHFRNTTFSKIFLEKKQPKPTRISACGSNSGLKVIVKNNPDDYFVGETPTYGTKVLIHDPVDFPGYAAQNAIVPAGANYFFTVSPVLTYATDSYKSLNFSERGCILDYERPMVIFNNYSWVNCLTECRIVMTYLACGCTPFFLRNIYIDWIPNNKACTLREIKCIAEYKHYFVNAMPELTFPFPEEQYRNACFCPPECEARQFFIETSRATLSRKYSVNEKTFYKGIHDKNFSVINVYFKDLVATRTKRDLSITWYTQLALFGGLLGLCFGFSFTSGFEIVYAFTIKIILDFIHQNSKVAPKKGTNEISVKPMDKAMVQISIINNFTKNNKHNINKDNLWYN